MFQAVLASGAVPVASAEMVGQIQAACREVLGREAGALADRTARLARGGTIARRRAELAHPAEAAAGVEAAYREALGPVDAGAPTGEAAAFARAVGEASAGATSAAAFARGDPAGGSSVGVNAPPSRMAREVFKDGSAGWWDADAAPPGATAGAQGAGAGSGAGSSWFDLDASALGWGGASGPAGLDVGGESAPAADGHTSYRARKTGRARDVPVHRPGAAG